MKYILKNTLFAIAVLSVSPAYAARNADSPVELPEYTTTDIAVLPTPTHHPIPQALGRLVGTHLDLKFTVNERGRPENVRLGKPLFFWDHDIYALSFAVEMRDRVAQWKFDPARNTAGDPVSVKVIMPVNVIKKDSAISTLASMILDTGDEDAS